MIGKKLTKNLVMKKNKESKINIKKMIGLEILKLLPRKKKKKN